ncbi:hypothetical protein AALB64_15200 [Lachnospiraceae bacterium 45-P1]
MRKIQKILIGTLLTGVLLGGIGTGMALVEYSSFAYAGEKTIGEENLVTREIDFKFEPEKGKLMVVHGYWDRRNYPNALEEDETVPVGVVRYVVTHNSRLTDVALNFDTYNQEDTEEEEIEAETEETPLQGYLSLQVRYVGNDFEMFMQSKDEILKELKQKQISSYNVAYITDVRIKVNPETRPYLDYETMY